MSAPTLAVVIPAFDESRRLGATLERVLAYLEQRGGSAEIVTATRKNVVSVPIQALTVREMLFDAKGNIVRDTTPRRRGGVVPTVDASEPPPGHERKEIEGVFLIAEGRAVFTPVKVGIAGERYFEVLSGIKAGDRVITGPFASVRGLADGEPVKVTTSQTTTSSTSVRSHQTGQ